MILKMKVLQVINHKELLYLILSSLLVTNLTYLVLFVCCPWNYTSVETLPQRLLHWRDQEGPCLKQKLPNDPSKCGALYFQLSNWVFQFSAWNPANVLANYHSMSCGNMSCREFWMILMLQCSLSHEPFEGYFAQVNPAFPITAMFAALPAHFLYMCSS